MKEKTKLNVAYGWAFLLLTFIVFQGCASYDAAKSRVESQERDWERASERWTAMHQGDVHEGMTKADVLELLGLPDRMNTTRGGWGKRVQWIYRDPYGAGRQYVYFIDGEVTSIQY